MSTEKIADRHHRESAEGVVAVLDRMLESLGSPAGGSYAMALDVSPNTIKTWRRRGEVPMKFLTEFAKDHQVSIDYLRFGAAPPAPEPSLAAQIDGDTRRAIVMVGEELRGQGGAVSGAERLKLVERARYYIQKGRELERKEADREAMGGKTNKV